MSQLSNPLSSGLVSFEDALHLLLSHAIPSKTLSLPLTEALGNVVVSDIKALHNVPSFDNSAVDGYGLIYNDSLHEKTGRFPLGDIVLADRTERPPHTPHTALPIMTGAPLPQNIDMVVMKEDVKREGDHIILPKAGLERGMNVRYKGEDVKAGDTLLSKSSLLFPPDIALLASQGYEAVEVIKPPRVGLLSTGDEVIGARDLHPLVVLDANRPMLFSALSFLGYPVEDGGIVSDTMPLLKNRLLSLCESCDVVITTGSMSAGISDHIASLIKDNGHLFVHGVAIKPGRPFGFGKIGSSFLCGLPGNPVAAYTCFLTLVLPFLRALRGISSPLNVSRETLRADFETKTRKGMREFVRVVTKREGTGRLIGKKHGRSGAAMISSLSQASGFAILSEDLTHVERGQKLPFLSFKDILS